MFALLLCDSHGRPNHVLLDVDTILNLCICVLVLVGLLVFGAICV